MADKEDALIDVEQTVRSLVQDIVDLSKMASSIQSPGNLKMPDMTGILPRSAARMFKRSLMRIKKEADKVAREQLSEIQEQTSSIEATIKARQDQMIASLHEIEGMPVDEETAQLVKAKLDEAIKDYSSQVKKLRLENLNPVNQAGISPSP